jgi:hypothetical protein
VESQDSQLHKLTKTFAALTSQIFRCPGLDSPAPDADRLGLHDIAYWLIFLSLGTGWFLFLFVPQRERLKWLEGRQQVLTSHIQAEKKELARLQRSIQDFAQNDPLAWERAARLRLGWVAPGEVVDVRRLRVEQPRNPQRQTREHAQQNPTLQGTIPQAPAIPSIPSATNFRTLFAPQVGTPPAIPQVQTVQNQPVIRYSQPAPASRTMRRTSR